MTKRLALVLVTITCLSVVLAPPVPVSAKDTWTSVRSKNFLLVGNASEKDIRQVGVRLEQFREVFARLFTTLNVNTPVPTTVVVFKNEESYRPFKPTQNAAGYFQAGPDINYITLRLGKEPPGEHDAFTIIFHEYTHLLIENTSGKVPTWFNEGLAEYYSSFSITDDQEVVMGRPLAGHVYLLREKRMLPLRTLFQVDQESPHYNESDKQSIFYAESWALIHYLMLGNEGRRKTQMIQFIELLAAAVPMEQAFQQAFAMTFENMEKELRAYIQRDRYPIIRTNFTNKLSYNAEMQSIPLTEAQAQAYLGDLLLHSDRPESEAYLQRALALDPGLAMANASMGMLREKQGRLVEARQCLERAVAASDQNYLINYYYAYVLSREGNRDMEAVMGFAPETATTMRLHLKRAIELRPDFPESYTLLAFVNLTTNYDLDETLKLLQQALARLPDRSGLLYMMAQIYVRKEDFKTARQLIDKLSGDNINADMRQRARRLLDYIATLEQHLARIREEKERWSSQPHTKSFEDARDENGQPVLIREVDPASILRESLRKPAHGETQAQGALLRIDCDAKGITFTVKVEGNILKLRTDSFLQVGFRTFSEDSGKEVTCGPRKPEDNVVIGYLPLKDSRARVDGIAKSFEFVPKDFQLKP